jgi:transcriptional regulator with XRE-family HTH domain
MILTGAQFKRFATFDLPSIERHAKGMAFWKHRLARNISRGEISSRIGVSVYSITRFEHGFEVPKHKKLASLIAWAMASIIVERLALSSPVSARG